MALTGTLFLTLVAVATAAAFVGLVVAWPALAGRRPLKVAGRAGLLLLVNALVVLTVASQLNAEFLFFADWTDLHGALNGSVTKTTVDRGGSASNAADRPVPGTAATPTPSLPPLPAEARTHDVLSYTVHGPASGITATVVVQLPPGYAAAVRAGVRFPVLETFNGYPGSPKQWIQTMRLEQALHDAVAARHLRPTLIVSPQVEVPAGVDTECVNGSPGYPQVETWLTRDVPNWVARTFGVRTERSSWATIGFSTGGWCAAMAAMLHPAQYGGAIVMGGYFRPYFGSLYEAFPPGSALAEHYNLVHLTRHRPPSVALWVETSHSDSLSYPSTAALLQAARPPLSVDATVLRHAGHRVSLWRGLLPQALQWLGASLAGFAPLS